MVSLFSVAVTNPGNKKLINSWEFRTENSRPAFKRPLPKYVLDAKKHFFQDDEDESLDEPVFPQEGLNHRPRPAVIQTSRPLSFPISFHSTHVVFPQQKDLRRSDSKTIKKFTVPEIVPTKSIFPRPKGNKNYPRRKLNVKMSFLSVFVLDFVQLLPTPLSPFSRPSFMDDNFAVKQRKDVLKIHPSAGAESFVLPKKSREELPKMEALKGFKMMNDPETTTQTINPKKISTPVFTEAAPLKAEEAEPKKELNKSHSFTPSKPRVADPIKLGLRQISQGVKGSI